jgi:molybdenum cofactor biosynthesis protein B
MVETLVGRDDVDTVVTVGGVGLTADEMAIEAVHPLLEKALPGFGEAFRSLLSDRLGTGIVGVRSTAGVSDGTLVFCLPGDREMAELAVAEILVAEAPALLAELR